MESRYLGGAPGTTGVYGQGGTGVGTTAGRSPPGVGGGGGGGGGGEGGGGGGGGCADGGGGGIEVGTALGHLCENRHGEWLEWASSLPSSQKFPRGVTFGGEEIINLPDGAAAVWGVSAVPPGMSKQEGDLYRSINDQQSR